MSSQTNALYFVDRKSNCSTSYVVYVFVTLCLPDMSIIAIWIVCNFCKMTQLQIILHICASLEAIASSIDERTSNMFLEVFTS